MKRVVKGFVVYRTESWYGEDERYQFWPWDPRGDKSCKDKVFIAEHTAEIDVPDNFDPRPQQVAQLVAQKEDARKQFSALCTEIDRRINSLLALEMTEPESEVDQYGNPTDGSEIINCCFPDCGCDGSRLCQAKNGASSVACAMNIERGSL